MRSSGCSDDIAVTANGNTAIKISTEYGPNRFMHDYMFETKLCRGGASYRPIHDLCLHSDSTRMAQAILTISQLGCPERYILQMKTDSILFDTPKKKAPAIEERLKAVKYKSLHALYAI